MGEGAGAGRVTSLKSSECPLSRVGVLRSDLDEWAAGGENEEWRVGPYSTKTIAATLFLVCECVWGWISFMEHLLRARWNVQIDRAQEDPVLGWSVGHERGRWAACAAPPAGCRGPRPLHVLLGHCRGRRVTFTVAGRGEAVRLL